MVLKMRMALDKDKQIRNQIIKNPDQIIDERVEAKFAKYKAEMEEKAKKDVEEKAKEDKNKLHKMVEDLKRQREQALEKAKDNDESPVCPTCHSHVHVSNGTRVKCVGPNCPKEFELVDMTSDLQCLRCGAPMKSDNVKNVDDGCPFCGGKKAKRFDYSKVWKIPKKTVGGEPLGGLGIGGLK